MYIVCYVIITKAIVLLWWYAST